MWYLEIIVYKIPLGGGGVYSQHKAKIVAFYSFGWYGATLFNIL